MKQCGHNVDVVLRTDASAARGVVERVGAGKVKHSSVKQLWAQDLVARGLMRVEKIPRLVNVSDALTHHWTSPEGARFWPMMGVVRVEAKDAPQMSDNIRISVVTSQL